MLVAPADAQKPSSTTAKLKSGDVCKCPYRTRDNHERKGNLTTSKHGGRGGGEEDFKLRRDHDELYCPTAAITQHKMSSYRGE